MGSKFRSADQLYLVKFVVIGSGLYSRVVTVKPANY